MTEKEMVKKELIKYGNKMVRSGLVGGAGGNISAKLGRIIYLSPSGYALDEMTEDSITGVDLDSGKIVEGTLRPTSEVLMHLECYRNRKEINAVVHTHSPWASGVISAGVSLKPMFPEFVADLGEVGYLDYILPTTKMLADAVAQQIKNFNAILMANHGVITVGRNLKEAYYRSVIIEEAAKSLVAATVVGKPRFLSREQIDQIKKLETIQYRQKVIG
ncbi:MAG TPA: class II aldolase/adducin family protein [Candidatus Aerophobetes bacterium]|uniref:Class II aldolase/adducin family protein n=1 Tax=Aerophobetes bacterium TaxID=2030807 RepID=A0A662D982_UNCAE|nr:MAG: class II aldolase/adducin family protein [Candidatus Aerophobetes bacterium]HDN84344.1 class II aldolase/adducin family protein [Candidatus Aerophobetes bacterium]